MYRTVNLTGYDTIRYEWQLFDNKYILHTHYLLKSGSLDSSSSQFHSTSVVSERQLQGPVKLGQNKQAILYS